MFNIFPVVVGGIPVDVYRHPASIDESSLPIYALFVLHGRLETTKNVEHIIDAILDHEQKDKKRDLIVLAFVRRTIQVMVSSINGHRKTTAITEED